MNSRHGIRAPSQLNILIWGDEDTDESKSNWSEKDGSNK